MRKRSVRSLKLSTLIMIASALFIVSMRLTQMIIDDGDDGDDGDNTEVARYAVVKTLS